MSTLSYFRFLLGSQNDHGIHSPFMFRFVSKCFYQKGALLSKKAYKEEKMETGYPAAALLYRVMNYLKPGKLFVLGAEAETVINMLRYTSEENKIKTWFFSPLAPIPGGAELAVIADNDQDAAMEFFEQGLANANNDTVCAIPNIHKTPQTEAVWHCIKQHPKANVTLDAYHLGLVFLRREQVRQHFMVRPSKLFLRDAVLGLRNLYGLLG